MAITITRADVKRKAMIPTDETDYDSAVDGLISEMQPAVQFTLADSYLNDSANTGLQATLKLGVLEIISGELLQQLAREFGATEQFTIGGVTVGQMQERGPALIAQGTVRLAPFLKSNCSMMAETAVQSTTRDSEPVFSIEEVS